MSLEKIRPAKESTQSKSFVRREGKEKKNGGRKKEGQGRREKGESYGLDKYQARHLPIRREAPSACKKEGKHREIEIVRCQVRFFR